MENAICQCSNVPRIKRARKTPLCAAGCGKECENDVFSLCRECFAEFLRVPSFDGKKSAPSKRRRVGSK